jgi:hypothetical protein
MQNYSHRLSMIFRQLITSPRRALVLTAVPGNTSVAPITTASKQG